MSEFNNNLDSEIFSEPAKKLTAKSKHAADFKRQMTALCIVAALMIIGIVAALVVNRLPGKFDDEAAESPYIKELPTLIDGEVIGPQNRIFIMEYLKNDNISEIKVHNEYGDFGVFYNKEDDNYYLTDNMNASYDREALQSLLSAAGYTLAMERITTDAEDMSEYGLADEDDPAWYEISDRRGNTHKLYIGNIIPSNAGYYVRYEGRNAVYVLDSSIANTLLAPIEALISPILAFPVGQSTYYLIDNFVLARDNEIFIALDYIPEEERSKDSSTSIHKLLYPEGYTPNDGNYLNVFAMFQEYTGMYTIKYQPDEEDLKKYGLDKPKYELYFDFANFPTDIWFSEKNDSGNFYAYSPVFDIITEVEYDKAKFLEWNLLEWLLRPVFQQNIREVKELTIESGEDKFTFVPGFDDNGLYSVYERNSGKYIEDIDNFKQFYMTLLMTSFLDYAELDEAQKETLTESAPYLTMKIKLNGGKTLDYKFYPYEARKSFYTINGTGHFYIVRDRMVKIVDDAKKVMSGERIFPDANN